ncbi:MULTISPECIES: carbohydrate ABC transporter permease [unclassified Streptomyces]|uniref:carbohydrate ABC transporter permease n=1 Tax=unclassified Streptomyces TaxID=2593676 RepID=UPI002DDB79F7|nr:MULTISPECIES: carbohydrate ABC transporter permease [unclassified Streptomyces]WSA91814.1 carbohydrate ABC transporter permease [Streptomyces sp. NBC_01795]WSB76184.1 carbohydrate ABC transporter permease [Streptomyces sp. NBC_01775]WSS15542.1 carbohydrate ABC transporter permease [Streptomyces sp. NBC_01186]WSS44383.1 carbohydrate ABC transporter permease [Streptomyces sp. NBC_01187]
MTTASTTAPADGGTPSEGAAQRGSGPGKVSEGATLNVFSHAFLVVWVVLAAGPLVWIAITAFRASGDILSDPMGLPDSLRWENFSHAWTEAKIGRYALNSVMILLGSLTGTMLLGSMAAYVIARFTFVGNRFIFLLFAGGMMFPVILALIPLFKMMDNFGLLDTRPGLMIAYIAYSLPFTTFFLTSFFRTLPSGVQEAAMVDGASHTRTFFQIMLPMAKPGLISIGIFNFLGQWNQYLLPLLLNSENEDNYVLPQGLASLAVAQGYRGDWGALFAGLTIAMAPVLVVYAVFQRQVQAGLTAGALK